MFSTDSESSNVQREWALTIERMNIRSPYTDITDPVDEASPSAQYLDIEPDEMLA